MFSISSLWTYESIDFTHQSIDDIFGVFFIFWQTNAMHSQLLRLEPIRSYVIMTIFFGNKTSLTLIFRRTPDIRLCIFFHKQLPPGQYCKKMYRTVSICFLFKNAQVRFFVFCTILSFLTATTNRYSFRISNIFIHSLEEHQIHGMTSQIHQKQTTIYLSGRKYVQKMIFGLVILCYQNQILIIDDYQHGALVL